MWLAGYVYHAAGMWHAPFVWPKHEIIIPLCRKWQPKTMDEQPIVWMF